METGHFPLLLLACGIPSHHLFAKLTTWTTSKLHSKLTSSFRHLNVNFIGEACAFECLFFKQIYGAIQMLFTIIIIIFTSLLACSCFLISALCESTFCETTSISSSLSRRSLESFCFWDMMSAYLQGEMVMNVNP